MQAFFFSRFGRYGVLALLPILLFIGTSKLSHADTVVTTASDHATENDGFGLIVVPNSAQSFIATQDGTISTIDAAIGMEGSPSDGVFLSIYTDGGGQPGSPLGSSDTQFPSGVGGSASVLTFTFSSPISVTNGVTYWIYYSRNGALDNSNNYTPSGTAPSSYADGSYAKDPGGIWAPLDQDAYTTFTIMTPSPPENGLAALVDMATSSYENTTGISMAAVTTWTSDNLLKLFLGSGIATLYLLRFWIVALMIFGAVVYFSFRALGFFKY